LYTVDDNYGTVSTFPLHLPYYGPNLQVAMAMALKHQLEQAQLRLSQLHLLVDEKEKVVAALEEKVSKQRNEKSCGVYGRGHLQYVLCLACRLHAAMLQKHACTVDRNAHPNVHLCMPGGDSTRELGIGSAAARGDKGTGE
jgi:hypothetical protein